MRRTIAALGFVLAAAAAPGCAGDDLGVAVEDVTLLDLYRNGDDVDLGDLLNVTAGFATREVNELLEVSGYGELELEPTELYALQEQASGDLTLHGIDELVSGLAHRYGERELTTEVNVARRNHLQSSGDQVYGESAFEIKVGHGWSHNIGGFEDVTAWLGFDVSSKLQARVISAYGSEWSGTIQSPLAAISASRGFVLPRSVEDLRALKPGESYALHGQGRLGVNLGVGVPIMVAAIDALTYNIVLSGAVRAMLEGEVDVQVVRLDGGRLVIDVGVERALVKQARVALTDGWGVHGLIKSNVKIGGLEIDLGRLVERAIERQLNAKLSLVEASYEKTKRTSRISVARFRIDLDKVGADSPITPALAQLLHADLRLAQALSNRSEPGIVQEFELSRSGVSSASYAGVDILGMRFFREEQEKEGSVVIQTPGGSRAILFESLHRSAGWFFSSHGYTRVGLSGMVFDQENPEGANGEANLLLQVVEGDDFMERDKLLDHLDGVIMGLGGPDALTAIEVPANALERFVEAECPNSQAFDPCRSTVLSKPKTVQLRADGIAALDAAVAHLDAPLRALVHQAGELRLTAQATYEPKASFVGPPTSIVVDYRLDDRALEHVMLQHTRGQVEEAFLGYLFASQIDRIDPDATIAKTRKSILKGYKKLAESLSKKYEGYAKRYEEQLTAENMRLPAHPELGEMGSSAIEIRFPVDSKKKVVYEQAVAGSLAQARSRIATGMFDKLVDVVDDDGKGLGNNPEQIVAYMLLALTAPKSADLRLDVDMDLGNNLAQNYTHYREAGYKSIDVYGRGIDVAPIDGGLFDIDELVNVE